MSEPKEHGPARLEGWSIFDDVSPTTGIEAAMRENQLAAARLRAKKSVLNLTEQDKRFLRAAGVAY